MIVRYNRTMKNIKRLISKFNIAKNSDVKSSTKIKLAVDAMDAILEDKESFPTDEILVKRFFRDNHLSNIDMSIDMSNLRRLFITFKGLFDKYSLEECRDIIMQVSTDFISNNTEYEIVVPTKYEGFSMSLFCSRYDDTLVQKKILYMIEDGINYMDERSYSHAIYILSQLSFV